MDLNLRFARKRSLRFLQWKELEDADGYKIEQWKNSQWQHFVWIRNPHLTECSVYTNNKIEEKFRVTAYQLDENNEEIFIGYDQIVLEPLARRMELPKMSKLLVGGRIPDALRINWVIDPNAKGYVVEQKVNGEWIRIGRVGDNKINTFRIGNLKPDTSYSFRMKAFAFDGPDPVYSEYQMIDMKTLPLPVIEK